jgi:hypothetical protein
MWRSSRPSRGTHPPGVEGGSETRTRFDPKHDDDNRGDRTSGARPGRARSRLRRHRRATDEELGEGRKIEPCGSQGRATPCFAERFAGILQTSSRTDVEWH